MPNRNGYDPVKARQDLIEKLRTSLAQLGEDVLEVRRAELNYAEHPYVDDLTTIMSALLDAHNKILRFVGKGRYLNDRINE